MDIKDGVCAYVHMHILITGCYHLDCIQYMHSLFVIVSGTSSILKQLSELEVLDSGDEVVETRTKCNKDTGEPKRLQKWTRGVWICASG